MQCRFLLPLFALFFLPRTAAAKVLFHADFECGETYTATVLQPGAKRIDLVPNFRLHEWPAEGGKGLIEANHPPLAEEFTYTSRQGAILQGVTGIHKSHPQWAGIRTSNLGEWIHMPRLQYVDTSGVSVVRQPALRGNYSARFNASTDKPEVVQLVRPLKGNELHFRFIAMFSEDLLRYPALDLPICYAAAQGSYLPRVMVIHDARLRKSFLLLSSNQDIEASIIHDNRNSLPIHAMREYRIEYAVQLQGSLCVETVLRVDGTEFFRMQTDCPVGTSFRDSDIQFTFGKTASQRVDGISPAFFADEVICADEAAADPPRAPSISHRAGVLSSSRLSGIGSHLASQWQIHPTNGWRLPLFDTGEERRFLTELQIPFFYLQPETMDAYDGPPLKPRHVATGLKSGRSYYARLRHQNSNHIWSEWSDPVVLTTGSVTADVPALPGPVMRMAFFAEPGQRRPLEQIVRGKWYDLYAFPSDPRGWMNLRYTDIYLSGDPDNVTTSYRNRGGVFVPGQNLAISLPRKDHGTYLRTQEGSTEFEEVVCGKTDMYDNTECRYLVRDTAAGYVCARVRIPPGSLVGPWVLKCVAVNMKGQFSGMYQSAFDVVENVPSPGRSPHLPLIVLGTIVFTGFLVLARSKRKAMEKPELATGKRSAVSGLPPKVRLAMEFVSEKYHQPIGVDDVAKAIGVSTDYLSKLFSKTTSKTLSRFINETRIENSKRLLRDGDLQITEIAFKTGFNSLDHFLRAFRSHESISPGAYRQQART